MIYAVAAQGQLFRTNHHLLCALGVGHPALSAVVEASEVRGMSCKLTGAGGGGCAITLLPLDKYIDSDSERQDVTDTLNLVEASGALVSDLEAALATLGFETFESSLAGRGVQWL